MIGNLRIHLGKHIGTAFSCTSCDKKYTTKFGLTTHIKTDHKEHKDTKDTLWWEKLISFHCKKCDLTGPGQMFPQHLEKFHQLHKLSGRGKTAKKRRMHIVIS